MLIEMFCAIFLPFATHANPQVQHPSLTGAQQLILKTSWGDPRSVTKNVQRAVERLHIVKTSNSILRIIAARDPPGGTAIEPASSTVIQSMPCLTAVPPPQPMSCLSSYYTNAASLTVSLPSSTIQDPASTVSIVSDTFLATEPSAAISSSAVAPSNPTFQSGVPTASGSSSADTSTSSAVFTQSMDASGISMSQSDRKPVPDKSTSTTSTNGDSQAISTYKQLNDRQHCLN